MKYYKKVQGSEEQAKPVVFGKDTVYRHENIHRIEDEYGGELYEYEEWQYNYDEWHDYELGYLVEQIYNNDMEYIIGG